MEETTYSRPDAADTERSKSQLDAILAKEPVSSETKQALMAMLHELGGTHRLVANARRELITTMDAVQIPLLLHDVDSHIVRANIAYANRAGMEIKAVIGKTYWNLFPKLDTPQPISLEAIQQNRYREEELSLPSGETFHVRYFPVVISKDKPPYLLQVFQDITAKKQAESEQKILSEALRQAAGAVLLIDAKGTVKYFNPAFHNLFGYQSEEMLGQNVSVLTVPGDTSSQQPSEVIAHLRTHAHWKGEVMRLAKDGRAVPVLLTASSIRDQHGAITGYVANYHDLRDLKEAGRHLQESEERFRAISTAAQDAILMLDDNGDIVFWNDSASKILGYPTAEAVGQNAHELLAPPNYHDAFRKAWPEFSRNGKGPVIGELVELEARRKDGTIFPIELSISALQLKGHWHAIGILRDITERKRSEQALQNALRAQRTISACNSVLVHTNQEQKLLAEMCNAIVEVGGYRLAWIGHVEHDDKKSIRPQANAGYEEGYLDSLNISWGDNEFGQGPTGRAVRAGTAQIAQNIATDPQFAPWREQALKRGYASSIALPLKEEDGEIFGVLNIYAADAAAFDDDERRLMQELADDLSFGVVALRARRERDHYQKQHFISNERLKEALIDTIRAVALTVEKRDPYTAGHQSRVADLATAIAYEMGMDDEQVEGLRLGAMIHDIGKIYIPAEILNRPGRLSEHEFGMIKSHPDVGYDIIKDVRFPWPVSEMVLQHHERLDGSGYPHGLKGNEITVEARIIAVADVVEAITAHRPYRPAFGLDRALAEIESNRGKLYDADVADACLRLFREKGYQMAQ